MYQISLPLWQVSQYAHFFLICETQLAKGSTKCLGGALKGADWVTKHCGFSGGFFSQLSASVKVNCKLLYRGENKMWNLKTVIKTSVCGGKEEQLEEVEALPNCIWKWFTED